MVRISKKTVQQPPQLQVEIKTEPKKNGLYLAGILVLAIVLLVVFFNRDKTSSPSTYPVKIVGQFTSDIEPGGNYRIWDLTLANDQSIVLSDQGGSRILYFDKDGKFEREVTQKAAGLPKFNEISGITSDEKGNVYVVDAWNGLVRGFSPEGQPTVQVPLKSVYGPRGVAWDKGALIVADTGTSRLLKVDMEGKAVKTWEKQEDGKNIFDNPTAVSVDASGNCYVADSGNKRIQSLNPEGRVIRQYKMEAAPSRVTVDSKNGLVYAASLEGDFTQVFTVAGKNLGKLMDVNKPEKPLGGISGLRVAEDGKLVVIINKDVKILQHVKK